MSYDIYCYRSKLVVPDEAEDNAIIENESEGEDLWEGSKDHDLNEAIVKALVAYNPKLEVFGLSNKDEEEDGFDSIEIEHPEEDFNLQIFVHENYVSFNLPYAYQGRKAGEIFDYLKAYIKIIGETAGYFVCDPQTGRVFDPAKEEFDGLNKYLSVSGNMHELMNAGNSHQPGKKPWWKFW